MGFEKRIEEYNSNKSNCPKDLANYINKKGGSKAFEARVKLSRHYSDLKVVSFIRKIEEAGEGVYDN